MNGNSGLQYLYMDDSTAGWTHGLKDINSNSGTLANTLKPFFDHYMYKTQDFGYILYSDQPPNRNPAPSSFGHSKGVVMLDRNTGVWLSHSTPKFPGTDINNFWPDTGTANAQTFICVTSPYSEFDQIGLQLMYIHIYSFNVHIPNTFPCKLKCVAQRSCYPTEGPWFRVKDMVSIKGSYFNSIAKYKRFGDDLYSGLLVDYLGQDLYVKSWGRMQKPLPSDCSVAHNVYNVLQVKPPNLQPFPDTVDHSKWCVASRTWTCIADMNREESQMGRGGGAICTDNLAVWKAFSAMVGICEPCPP
ncbi:deoxyribonuclease-2-alpha-like [Centroberyx gerrardi]|uniref:deoxyribonuclease-2-alpha-like n=1 Tax=Centroberyx gerrardi TaxID=166262 RepID=UPI003AAB55CD